MDMQGKKQLERDTTVGAPAEAVYRLFMDNAELANWAPAVDAVTGENGGDETGLGATRTCAVTMNGAKGTMVERCIEAVPSARASFLVVDDSFGFTTMFTGYGFTAHFTPVEAGRPGCGSRRSTHRRTRSPPCSTRSSSAAGSAASWTSSSPGCAPSPSGARPSPKTSPSTLTPRAKARSGTGNVPAAGRAGTRRPGIGLLWPPSLATARPAAASCPAAGPSIEVTEGDRAAAPSRRYGVASLPPSLIDGGVRIRG